ncbi:MAG TPA: Wzz/FepE/Etk N-terminal domain-containing protein [Anaerolineales bacterium]
MADSEFTPFHTLARILSRWWITIILALIGGIIGWGFHFFHAPVYEATSILTVNMDFSQRVLTQYEEDYAFNAAGNIINSTAVKDQIVTKAQTDGISVDPTRLAQQMFAERRQSVWELHIRDRDPQIAAELANIWAQMAKDALNAALEHALGAEQFQNQVDLLEACQPVAPGTTESTPLPSPIPQDCGRYSLADIQTEIQSWANALVQEKNLSFGILPVMEFALTGEASIPEKPVLYNRASLTLAGALIGFVISLWVAGIRWGQRSA